MTITTTLSNIKNSTVALNVLSTVTVIAAAIAADRNKPLIATSLVGFSTVLAAREVYVRHVRGAKAIQTILMKSKEVSEMDVPADIVAAMKSSKASEPKTETEEEFLDRIDPENFIH